MLHNNNFKNNFDTVIANNKIEINQLQSKYVYSDIDNRNQNLALKLLSIIDNIKSVITAISNITILIIIYYNKDYHIFFND